MHILGENTVTRGNSKGKNLGRNISSMFKEQPDWCGWCEQERWGVQKHRALSLCFVVNVMQNILKGSEIRRDIISTGISKRSLCFLYANQTSVESEQKTGHKAFGGGPSEGFDGAILMKSLEVLGFLTYFRDRVKGLTNVFWV